MFQMSKCSKTITVNSYINDVTSPYFVVTPFSFLNNVQLSGAD